MRSANLLALLDESQEEKDLVKSMVHRLRLQEKEGLRGFRLAEKMDPVHPGDRLTMDVASTKGGTLKTIPAFALPSLRGLLQSRFQDPDLLVSPQAIFLESISHRNSIYATGNSRRYRDSSVLFKSGEAEEAGVIDSIFVHEYRDPLSDNVHADSYILVDMYDRMDDDDRFRKYGYAGGFCCQPVTSSKHLIRLEDLLCHVALTKFEEEGLVHVLPVNRVGPSHVSQTRS